MNPERVTSAFPHSLEAQLLRAGRAMPPPPGSAERVLAGLGLGATVTIGSVAAKAAVGAAGASKVGTTAAATSQAAAWASGLGWVVSKYVGVGLFVGFSAYSASQLVELRPSANVRSLVPPPRSSTAHPMAAAARSVTSTTAAAPSEPGIPSQAAVFPVGLGRKPTPKQEQPASTRVAGWAGSGQAGRPVQARLKQEVVLIDQTRQAIAQGDHAEALRLIERHGREFPSPRLGEEATFLRVQALARTGRLREAQRAFDSLAGAHPDSSLLPALRAELGRP